MIPSPRGITTASTRPQNSDALRREAQPRSLVSTHKIEAWLIEKALGEIVGSNTRAARPLGIPRRSLAGLLKTRHRKLMGKRTPAERRKRSIIRKSVDD